MEKEKRSDEKMRLRDNLYAHIKIPLKTMDLIIGFLVAALIIFLVAGILPAVWPK